MSEEIPEYPMIEPTLNLCLTPAEAEGIKQMEPGSEVTLTITGTVKSMAMTEYSTDLSLRPNKVQIDDQEPMTLEKALDRHARRRGRY